MNGNDIVRAIKQHLSGYKSPDDQYNKWRIGITHDLEERRAHHKRNGRDVSAWEHWEAGSLGVAQNVENYFLNEVENGMTGGTGGDMDDRKTTWVYVF